MKTVAAAIKAIFGRDKNTANQQPGTISRAQYRRAIAELNRCSDAELRDIGITRGDISDAVFNGREIDRYRHAA